MPERKPGPKRLVTKYNAGPLQHFLNGERQCIDPGSSGSLADRDSCRVTDHLCDGRELGVRSDDPRVEFSENAQRIRFKFFWDPDAAQQPPPMP